MLSVKLVPAEYGDCILVSIKGKQCMNILIDGGTKRTYEYFLQHEIEEIKNKGGKLNLVICTHIDDDHIAGLVEMLKNEDNNCITNVWYNGFLQIINRKYYSLPSNNHTESDNKILDGIILRGNSAGGMHEVGIHSAMSFGVLAYEKNIPINSIVEGRAISSEMIEQPIRIDKSITIIIIAPSREDLLLLEDSWKKEMVAQNYTFHVSDEIKLGVAFEYQLGQIKMFYSDERVMVSENDTLEKYMGKLSAVDSSPVNASSISFILDYNNKKYLFLGDTVIGLQLLDSIENIVGKYYRFAAIKLPHHGSRYNITLDFIERYTADEYYFLTNSKRFNHPDLEVLSTIICKDSREKKLIFNYPIEKAHFINKQEWKKKYHYEVIMGDGNSVIERIFE